MSGPDMIVACVVFGGLGAVALTLARGFAKRIAGGTPGSREVEALREEVAELRSELDDVRRRVEPVDEIQNRLDFTERMLAQARERGLLNAPKER